jgi:hypothetical protein
LTPRSTTPSPRRALQATSESKTDENQSLHDFRFAGGDFIESVHSLQFTKEQFDYPPCLIELRDIRRVVPLSGEIRDTEVATLVLFVPDPDDTEHLNGTAARAVVDASFEIDFSFDIDRPW